MQIKMYVTPTCAYCHLAEKFFKENNVEYEKVDISIDKEAKMYILEKTGRLAVPVFETESEVFIGYSVDKLKEVLKLS